MTTLRLGKLHLNTLDFASQGSAVLGIRGSGKTYTASLLAERLFDAGVPFISFDPIGVWRFLRVPGDGRGYPVVVAGGQAGDLPLSPASAPKIVEAAIHNGVSLVIDLFDINLSKADWRRIVRDSVRLLLHRNSQHGLRHVFLEEAAEFAPQRVLDGDVYAEIEKLARMGGNARLGYTLINQRAEEVNKAVLELCDNLFLHRQKGRNSLTALSKWLDIGNVKDHREIIDSLATLPTGECWAWIGGTERPVHWAVPTKTSLHPDRRVMRGDAEAKTKRAVDVTTFVTGMRDALPQIEAEAAANDPKALRAQIAKLQRQLQEGRPAPAVDTDAIEQKGYTRGLREGLLRVRQISKDIAAVSGAVEKAEAAAKRLAANAGAVVEAPAMPPPAAEPPARPLRQARPVVRHANGNGAAHTDTGVTRPQQRILDAILWLECVGVAPAGKEAVAFLAEASSTSGGYFNNLGRLRASGLIDYPQPGCLALTEAGRGKANTPDQPGTLDDLHEAVRRKLSPALVKVLDVAIDAWPESLDKDAVAEKAGVSPTSGGYFNNLGRLRTLGLIYYPQKGRVSATRVLFPEGLQ